jgi:iron(III) transport system ATP-binding protein
LREDVRDTLRQVGATALFVTHDQEEAFSIADEVAVMQRGRIVQHGTPQAIYAQPATREIATFVGDANFLPGDISDRSSETVRCALGRLPLALTSLGSAGPVDVLIRPEQVHAHPDPNGRGVVQHITFFGHDQLVQICIDGALLLNARTFLRTDLHIGAVVDVAAMGKVMAYPRSLS